MSQSRTKFARAPWNSRYRLYKNFLRLESGMLVSFFNRCHALTPLCRPAVHYNWEMTRQWSRAGSGKSRIPLTANRNPKLGQISHLQCFAASVQISCPSDGCCRPVFMESNILVPDELTKYLRPESAVSASQSGSKKSRKPNIPREYRDETVIMTTSAGNKAIAKEVTGYANIFCNFRNGIYDVFLRMPCSMRSFCSWEYL